MSKAKQENFIRLLFVRLYLPVVEDFKTVLERVLNNTFDYQENLNFDVDLDVKSLTDDKEYLMSPPKKPLELEKTIRYLAKRLESTGYNIRELLSELPASDTLRVLWKLELKSIEKNEFRDYRLYSFAGLLASIYGDWSNNKPVSKEPLVKYLSLIDHFIIDKNIHNLTTEGCAEAYFESGKMHFYASNKGIQFYKRLSTSALGKDVLLPLKVLLRHSRKL